ncbi:hypothetical protein BA898_06460 [Spiribacter roseus]|nr:hypothetical protein BBH56_03070 [Spiribacter roseus]KAF0282846.1 hypothetical protein BA898_06460 [Spiribacter roseus]KAF0285783.1 hypothetical protein BA899_00965 [Spiribacter sp. SSL99]
MDSPGAAMTRRWLLVGAVVAAIAIGLSVRDQISREAIAAWVNGMGPWAGLGFVAAYALGTVAFLPGLVFTISGGALFGPLWGTLYSLMGATVGATLAFAAARHGLGPAIERRSGARLNRLQAGIDREGWRFVALMRLVPLVPFNLLNYMLGLTRIRLRVYVLTSMVAMAPGALAYVWIGHAGRQALIGGGNVVQAALIAIALVAGLAFVPRLVRSLRGGLPDVDDPPSNDSH